jgi:FAD/FMN-containing dehydrogenase
MSTLSTHSYCRSIQILTTNLANSAILIDLGKLKQTDLDERHGIVKISPSTTNRVLDTYLATKGKMFPGGHCPDVGVGGFLLGGGIGWNCRVCGLLPLFGISY